MRKIALVAVLTVGVLTSSSNRAVADDKKESKPTGACTISVYGLSDTCTSGMTEESCNNIAKKVGGVAKWEKAKSCK